MEERLDEQVRRGSVITVFSTASAVGKTLVAINMAAELARLGHKVCLVDVDLQFGYRRLVSHEQPPLVAVVIVVVAKFDACVPDSAA